MEIVACVVGAADVTARASSKIWRLCELWKDAPQDAYHLRDELGRASRFFDAIKSGIQESFSVSPSQTVLMDLTSLLNQGHHTVSTLQVLFDELLSDRDGLEKDSGALPHQNSAVELSKKRKLRWMKRLHKIKRLRASLRQTTEQIGLFLSLLNVTLASGTAPSNASLPETRQLPVDVPQKPPHVPESPFPNKNQEGVKKHDIADISFTVMSEGPNNALSKLDREVMEELATKIDSHTRQIEETKSLIVSLRNDIELKSHTNGYRQVIDQTDNGSNTAGTVHISPLLCRQNCRCACHSTVNHNRWQVCGLSWSVIGFLRVVFTTTLPQPCNDLGCRLSSREAYERRRCYLAMQYSLPSWISSTIFSLYAKTISGGPELLIRISQVVDPQRGSTDNTIFQSALQSNLDGLKASIAARPSCVNDIMGGVGRARRTPLSLALSAGLVVSPKDGADAIRLLVRAGADVRFEETQGLTLLQSAFRRFLSGRRGCETLPDILPFEELVEDEGFTTLHKVAYRMSTMVNLEKELARPVVKAMVNARTTSGMTPLHLAALAGNIQVVRLLLAAGADPDALSDSKTTPIRLALLGTRPGHNPETARILLAACTSISTVTESGVSPLHLLCENTSFSEQDRLDLLRQLISRGADVNAETTTYKRTPLERAAGLNNIYIVPHLIYHGADINHQDWEGDTALNEAIYSRSHETAEYLLDHGANYHLRSKNGDTMLHLVARYGDKRILDVVADAGIRDVDVNAANNAGQTAVDVLARREGVDEQFRYKFLQLVGSIIRSSKSRQTRGYNASDCGDESTEEEEFHDASENWAC